MKKDSRFKKLLQPYTKIEVSKNWMRGGMLKICYLLPIYCCLLQTAGSAQAGVVQSSQLSNEPVPVAQRVQNYQYLVYVNGDSPLLLEQVRTVEPQAFVRFFDEQNVIQSGLFNEQQDAKKRVESLNAIGIRANVARIEVVPSIPEYRAEIPEELYLVYVSGDSDLLLNEVRKVEPRAVARTYQGERIIQAGLFNERENARQRVTALNSIGVRAGITKVNEQVQPDYTKYPPNQRRRSQRLNSKNYYVVIPAREKYLPDIAETVELLGAPVDGILERERPLGNHVAVGPFPDRGTAERWNRYLLDFGLSNARVYYGR
jgi:hypothetical protein